MGGIRYLLLAGAVIRLPAGIYDGPAIIGKPITLDGYGQLVIEAGGHGTVLTVHASNVTLRGLTLRGSGASHDALDGGLMAEGDNSLIENNDIRQIRDTTVTDSPRNRFVGNRVARNVTGIYFYGA